MALKRWVINASPLILLGKVHWLDLLGVLADHIAIPNIIVAEVSAKLCRDFSM